MRLKKVKGATEEIEASSYIIKEPEKKKGHYQELFQNNNPIHIEIGMGKGKFVIEHANTHPDINYIGIEKFDSVIVRAVQKLQNTDIKNLKLIRIDALELDNIFEKEIDTIYLNFSDPWPKNRHSKRRLTSKIFLDKYEKMSKQDCHIIMKTDNRKLFEYSLVSFSQNGYEIINISLNLHEDSVLDNIMTEYEEKFVKKGQVIYMVEAIKTRN